MPIFKLISYFSAIVLLASCGDADNSLPPAELTQFNAKAEFVINWKNESIEGVKQKYVQLEPLVIDGNAITASRDGLISSVDLKSGKITKQQDIAEIISAGVGGNNKTIIVATLNGQVVALDSKTLEIKWRKTVSSEVLSKPVVYEDLIIVRSSDGNILALNDLDGEIVWSYKQVIPALTLRGSSSPVVARNRLFTGMENGRLIALSPTNGEVIWDIALAVPKGRSEINRLVDIDGHAELYGQVLYVASYQGRVAAIDVVRGQILWARPFSSNVGVTVDSKAVYSTDERGHIWAVDRFSGATLWRQDKLQARSVTRPIMYGEYLLVGDYASYIHVLSRFDGSFVARIKLSPREIVEFEDVPGILAAPIVIGDNILISSRDGNLYFLSLKDKTQKSAAKKL